MIRWFLVNLIELGNYHYSPRQTLIYFLSSRQLHINGILQYIENYFLKLAIL